jgi:hypothetical protein
MKIGVSEASAVFARAQVSERLQRLDGHEAVLITRTPETVSPPGQVDFANNNRPGSLADANVGLDCLAEAAKMIVEIGVSPVEKQAAGTGEDA